MHWQIILNGQGSKYISIKFERQTKCNSGWHYDEHAKRTFLMELVNQSNQQTDLPNKLCLGLNPDTTTIYSSNQSHVMDAPLEFLTIPYRENRCISFDNKRGRVLHRGPLIKECPTESPNMFSHVESDRSQIKKESHSQSARIFLQVKERDDGWLEV